MFSEAQFNLFILAWVALAIVVFVILMFINAPYGRHLRDGWGINIPARLGWIAMESPTMILMSLYMYCLLYTSPSPRDATLSRMPSSA